MSIMNMFLILMHYFGDNNTMNICQIINLLEKIKMVVHASRKRLV